MKDILTENVKSFEPAVSKAIPFQQSEAMANAIICV
jgi:hypothetical protein